MAQNKTYEEIHLGDSYVDAQDRPSSDFFSASAPPDNDLDINWEVVSDNEEELELEKGIDKLLAGRSDRRRGNLRRWALYFLAIASPMTNSINDKRILWCR